MLVAYYEIQSSKTDKQELLHYAVRRILLLLKRETTVAGQLVVLVAVLLLILKQLELSLTNLKMTLR